MKHKLLITTLFTVAALSTTSIKAHASVFTDLTDNKLDKVEQQIETKKDKIETIQNSKDVTYVTISSLTAESSKFDKDKAATQAEKDKVAKEIEAVKAQIKAKQDQKAAEDKKQAEEKQKSENEANLLSLNSSNSAEPVTNETSTTPTDSTAPQFGSNGLLVEQSTPAAQNVINLLMSIPGHAKGKTLHLSTIDKYIDGLSTPESIYVIHRIEGAGFGQTGDGMAGFDTPASHANFVKKQINNRFGGSIHNLLKSWGTYSYSGY